MRNLLYALAFSFFYLAAKAQDTTQKVVLNRTNSAVQQQKPYVILISIDALRWDLVDKYQAKNLMKLRESGVQADYLKPAFPSLTFPNHYSIITGLYPSHHGIVDNNFYDKTRAILYKKSDPKMALDSSWYGGKPLWILAEEQQMLSAVFYWPGSEVSMNGIRPTYYYNYNERIPIQKRIAIVKDWLQLPAEKRPHFIALYFPEVDKAAHRHTADSEETKAAVQLIDETIAKLVDEVKTTGLAINFVFLSDHGMTTIDRENTIALPAVLDPKLFIVPAGNALLHVYANAQKSVLPTYNSLKAAARNYDVYLSKNIPKAWHYNKKEDVYHRIGDILLVPRLPKVFSINGIKPDIGQHGFDPAVKDMHATFYAWGPQFKQGLRIPAFENINVYPLIAEILGLNFTNKIDGKGKVLRGTLKVK